MIAAAAAALLSGDQSDPWQALTGFRSASTPDRRIAVEVAGKTYIVQPAAGGTARDIDGSKVLFMDGGAWLFSAPQPEKTGETGTDDGAVLAPMPGAVILVEAVKGQLVKRGQRLLVLEAMKMEYVLMAPVDGTVAELAVTMGSQVEEGALLARIER